MRSFRLLLALAFVAATGVVAGPVGAACAGEGARAALVVDTGTAVTAYCVALPGDSVNGIELVELAGEQHGLDYSLGFGGEAVCRLEGVGPEGDDCFGEYPEFWGYWHGNGSGGWTWAGTGAGSASIEDGDVDAWSWGAGDNGSNHQQPPPTEYSYVCAVAPSSLPAKTDRPEGESRRAPPAPAPAAPAPGVVAEAPEPDGASPGRRPRRAGRDRPVPSPSPPPVAAGPTPAPSSLAARPANDEDETGPPVTGLLGHGAAAALAGAVWSGTRRRPKA